MCIDLIVIDKSVGREMNPFPRVESAVWGEDLLEVANSRFWQIKLDLCSRLLTTFITHWGRFFAKA